MPLSAHRSVWKRSRSLQLVDFVAQKTITKRFPKVKSDTHLLFYFRQRFVKFQHSHRLGREPAKSNVLLVWPGAKRKAHSLVSPTRRAERGRNLNAEIGSPRLLCKV